MGKKKKDTQDLNERDTRLLKTLALLRVIVFQQSIPLFFKGVETTAHTVLTRYARPDTNRQAYIHYFNKVSSEMPIGGLKFIALTEEGADKAGMDKSKIDSRSWGFGSALDLHLSSSIYVIESLLASDKEKAAMRWEESKLQEIFGVEFPPQVPWIVRTHLSRPAVFRAYSGADASDIRRTLKEMRELAIGPLVACGDVGLLVLAPTAEAKVNLAKELKPLMKDVRLIIHESPNSETAVKYLNARYRLAPDAVPPSGDSSRVSS